MHPRHARRRGGSRRALVAVAACLVVVGGTALLRVVEPPVVEPASRVVEPASRVVEPASRVVEPASRVVEPVETPPAVRAAAVLRGWDRARADAWARGSVRALRRLYVDGAGASDVRLLEGYLERGLRVRGLRMQVLALDVLDRDPGEWRLRVTDRIARATATADGRTHPLPRDRASTSILRLVRVGGEWLMAAVR